MPRLQDLLKLRPPALFLRCAYRQLSLIMGGMAGLIALGYYGLPQPSAQATQIPRPDTPLNNPWANASFPVEGFQAYTSPFGYRQHPTLGSRRFHYGLDIAAPMGSYIRNWWDGTVAQVSDNTSCGTSVVVQSGDWTHIYCHMQGHVVWEADGDRVMVDRAGGIEIVQGQTVKAGTPIGRVGVTGRTTGPHLHWGMKYQGSWIDPALVIKAMYAAQSQAGE